MIRRLFRHRRALLGGLIVAFVLVLAASGPALAPQDYTETDLGGVWAPPSEEHWLGGDKLGRDILSRLIVGARVSMIAAGSVLAITMAVGVTIGMLAGYHGGLLDAVLMRATDIMLAFPELIFAILITAILGAGLGSVVLALSLAWWPGIARLTRSLVLAMRKELFLEAAIACGTPTGKILLRHVLPNIVPALIVRASIGVGFIIMAEATLSFLGIGVQEPTPSWGGMIRDGLEGLRTDPYLALFSSAALGATILGFNLLGDGLRDVLDPRVAET
jgi:ABC-type dipeptide/oligopeptide/nickel transport system permease subunit